MERKLYEAADQLPQTTLEFEDIQTPAKTKRRPWGALATAACLLLALCVGGCAFVAETTEYNAAVRFFETYDLSTDGLTRGQIKAVYRDITTNSFTYSKTSEVLQNSLSSQVEGWEITQEPLSSEALEAIWGRIINCWSYETAGHIRYCGKINYENGQYVGTTVAKYEGTTQLWSIFLEGRHINGLVTVSDGVILCDSYTYLSTTDYHIGAIIKISEDGQVLWTQPLDNGRTSLWPCAVVEDSNGDLAVFFSYEENQLRRYSADGQLLEVISLDVGSYRIRNAIRSGEGYLLYLVGADEKVVKMDKDGNVTDAYIYETEDMDYTIVDMMEYEGKLYLSTYAGSAESGFRDIAWQYVMDSDSLDIDGDTLTALFEEYYTAVLLVCDLDTGVPETFYTIPGALGGGLSVNSEGQLVWEVEDFVSSYWSPATSAYTFVASCYFYAYTFHADGTLLSRQGTDRTDLFRQ